MAGREKGPGVEEVIPTSGSHTRMEVAALHR